MDLVISNKIEKPIYEQVYQQIIEQIISGELMPDEMLPSIRQTASSAGVSVITVKKAWKMLESDGFIYTKAGKGCFVATIKSAALEDKRLQLAAAALIKDLEFYKALKLSKDELIALINKEYQ